MLRMLEQHLGPDVFREGRAALPRAAPLCGNAETTDLWQALGDAARQPIPAIMDGWIFKPGYPVVTVDLEGGGLKLSQRRFQYLGGETDSGQRWRIPVVLRAAVKRGYVERRLLLDGEAASVELPAKADWIVVNSGGHGFYRVRYGPALLKKLAHAAMKIAPIERFNLLSDSFALAQAGLMPAVDYLDLTARFTAESDRNVWTALDSSLAYVNRVIPAELRGELWPHSCGTASPRRSPSSAGKSRKRRPSSIASSAATLLRTIGTLGDDEDVQARAREAYARYREDESSLDANVLPAVIAILAARGGESEYAEFRDRFKSARTPQEEQRYLYALAGFRQAELLGRTLEMTLNGEIRSQDAPYVIRSLLASVYGRGLAWDFIKGNWQAMARQYPESAYTRMYEGIAALVSAEWERDVRAFFAENKIDLGGKTLRAVPRAAPGGRGLPGARSRGARRASLPAEITVVRWSRFLPPLIDQGGPAHEVRHRHVPRGLCHTGRRARARARRAWFRDRSGCPSTRTYSGQPQEPVAGRPQPAAGVLALARSLRGPRGGGGA